MGQVAAQETTGMNRLEDTFVAIVQTHAEGSAHDDDGVEQGVWS